MKRIDLDGDPDVAQRAWQTYLSMSVSLDETAEEYDKAGMVLNARITERKADRCIRAAIAELTDPQPEGLP
jgi:hypothetical protein